MPEKMKIEIKQTQCTSKVAWWWFWPMNSVVELSRGGDRYGVGSTDNMDTKEEAIAHATKFWGRYGVEIEVVE